MALSDVFKNAAVTAFSAAGDLVTSCTYRSMTSASASYDYSTGVVTQPYTDYTVSMLFARYDNRQIDGNVVLMTDEKALIPTENMTPTPKLHDLIVKSDSSVWDIVNISKDPAGALYIFQIRKK